MSKLDFSVEPKGATGSVLVFHEVWGLTEHTKDVCKRLGKLGFAAAAPNLFKGHEALLTPENVQKAMEAVWDLTLEERWDRSKVDAALARKKPGLEVVEAVNTLYDRGFRESILTAATGMVEESAARFGGASALGFSFGGGIALRVAARTPNIRSAVSYYGDPPNGDDLRRIASPLLAIYAGEDQFMNRRVKEFTEAAVMAGKDLTLRIIPGANHDFFDDTKASYDRQAAAEAWELTERFLQRTLGSKKL